MTIPLDLCVGKFERENCANESANFGEEFRAIGRLNKQAIGWREKFIGV